MMVPEAEARRLVLEAGRRLLASGLIVRTWGNVSARISPTRFVITPTGRAYETLKPEDLPVVDWEEDVWTGPYKPSSEKGVHADVYRLRPEAGFVIHTHQTKASVAGIPGEDLLIPDADLKSVLGDSVPCAEYGISATKMLRKAVFSCLKENPQAKAILLRSHGVLCAGSDFSEAFAVSTALETAAAREIERKVLSSGNFPRYSDDLRRSLYLRKEGGILPDPETVPDFGRSFREGMRFTLEIGGEISVHDLSEKAETISPAVRLHAQTYRTNPVTHLIHLKNPEVLAVSAAGKTLVPSLDDLAQIGGVRIRCADPASAPRRIRGNNAVLIRGCGALCGGNSASDAEAACLVLGKGCEAEIYASFCAKGHPLGWGDASLQRWFYQKKYAKRMK